MSKFLTMEVSLPPGGLFKPFGLILKAKMLIANNKINNRIQRAIKEEHRYKHRTRNLRNATKSKGRITDEKGLIISVDEAKAPYAKYIIDGHHMDEDGEGGWQPDPYLDAALEEYKEWIIEVIEKATGSAILDFNVR